MGASEGLTEEGRRANFPRGFWTSSSFLCEAGDSAISFTESRTIRRDMLSPNTTRQPPRGEEAEVAHDISSALEASRSPAETEEVPRIATIVSSTATDQRSESLKQN